MKLKLRLNIETKEQNLKKKQILKILNYTLCDKVLYPLPTA